MSNTYHQVYVQTVFAVKYRAAVIRPEWKASLMAVIGNLIRETGCKTLIVNGVEDHVHCLFGLLSSLAISDVMKNAKAKSSKWLNESGLLEHRFEWQSGFGAFSYSKNAVLSVYNYIKNQERHHEQQRFLEEYKQLLQTYEVDYRDQYIFHEPL